MRVPLKIKHLGKTYFAWVDEEDYTKIYRYGWCIGSRHGKVLDVHAKMNNKTVKLHRHLMGCKSGDEKIVDHIDRDPLNNCKTNLRVATYSINNRSVTKKANTSSQFPGVCWNKRSRKWRANIKINRRNKFLGNFVIEEMAAKVYRDAALKVDPMIYHPIWSKLK